MPTKPLDPTAIYRVQDARSLFGYGPSVLRERIKNGTLPKPVLLAPPPSRARGWYGWMVNEWRERVDKQQQQWAEDAKNFYVPTPPNNKKPMKPPVKKVKLKRPVRLPRRSAKG
jgi:predicted DNA-binding transcriptional regulator AlpA